MHKNGFSLEICANSYQSVEAAVKGGAHRVELCDNLHEGGTTPSIGLVATCLKDFSIPLFPIIRPRGGDFIYTDQDLEIMCSDIEAFKALGCKGVVIGCLDRQLNIHVAYTKQLLKAAQNMEVSYHRAFDRCHDLPQALNTLVELGIRRVLTSGGKPTAVEGLSKLVKLQQQAGERIEIMLGSGVNVDNIAQLYQDTGAKIYHTTAKSTYKSQGSNSINITEEIEMTDSRKVAELIKTLSTLT